MAWQTRQLLARSLVLLLAEHTINQAKTTMHVTILKTHIYFDYYIKILRHTCTNFYQAATLSELGI